MNINRRDFLLGMATGAGATMLPLGYQFVSGPSIPHHQELVARFNNEKPSLCTSDSATYPDMYAFHKSWHTQNFLPEDRAPNRYNDRFAYSGPEWEVGTRFLIMHHQMYLGILEWYRIHDEPLPPIAPDEWAEDGTIPTALDYVPTKDNLPGRVTVNFRSSKWKRNDNPQPKLVLPSYFRPEGAVADQNETELNTGFSVLNEFVNTNQLGCCLSFIHGIWHSKTIGGISETLGYSIVDPVFYFGIHALIDRTLKDWLKLNGLDFSHVTGDRFCNQGTCQNKSADQINATVVNSKI